MSNLTCFYIAIPTLPGGANHTRAFTDAAASDAAHEVCYNISKALAHVGMRALTDETFLTKVSFMLLLGGTTKC
jgi:hypothetical protein